MRRTTGIPAAVAAALAIAGAVAVVPTAASSDDGADGTVLRFDRMAGVVEPFTGTAHPVRGVPGGGLPWQVDRARGELRADGRLRIKVQGLVLARRAPVPDNLQGTNPIPQFRGAVNCLTPAAPDTGVTTATDPVPASADGDATIDDRIALPSDCVAPVVFVTSPTGAWFAATGR